MTSKHTKQDSLTSDSGYSSGSSALEKGKIRDGLIALREIKKQNYENFLKEVVFRLDTYPENWQMIIQSFKQETLKSGIRDCWSEIDSSIAQVENIDSSSIGLSILAIAQTKAILKLGMFEEVIESHEKSSKLDIKKSILNCKDNNSLNILHCIADQIVRKHENAAFGLNSGVSKEDLFVYEQISQQFSELTLEEDIMERTPDQIIFSANIEEEKESLFLIWKD